MEIFYNLVVPIIAAIIGGFICGLFTYLGIKLLLKNEKTYDASKTERNQYINNVVKAQRPELTLKKNPYDIKDTVEIYLLPYMNPILKDKETIEFQYTNEIFDENYWSQYEIILENTGKRTIRSMFLQLQYKCGINAYSKVELYAWQRTWLRNYYQDKLCCNVTLKPEEKIKLIVHFPKCVNQIESIPFDMYIHDEDDNYWYQLNVNCENRCESELIAPDAYYMHLRQEYYRWFIYDNMYYTDNIKKSFRANTRIRKVLENRKKTITIRIEKQQQFVGNVNNGKIMLGHNYPINFKAY